MFSDYKKVLRESGHQFYSPLSPAETAQAITTFLENERHNPGSMFSGRVEDGWVYIGANNSLMPWHEFRGKIHQANDGNGCVTDLLVSPKPWTMLLALFTFLAVLVGAFFFVAYVAAQHGGGSVLAGVQLFTFVLLGVSVLGFFVLMRKPYEIRALLKRRLGERVGL